MPSFDVAGVAVDLFMDALAGVRPDVVAMVGIEVWTNVSAKAFVGVTASLEFAARTAPKEFSP